MRTLSAIRTRRGLIAVLVGVALALPTVQAERADAAATLPEKRMHRKINDARRDRGLVTLRLNTRLSDVARRHSRKMADDGRLSHRNPLSAGLDGMKWSSLAENVGYGSTVSVVFRAFMDSRPHRRNILG
ncbi:MAG: CAP domain-containing protein, partial [Actinomycetota bacterium]|nr:CAP domain-containing protein [Actinomycetota bacterium]